jgi:hypothetical protein
MTPLQATQIVYDAVRDAAAAGTIECAYAFEGERFAPVAGEPWIRISVRDLPTTEATHGRIGHRVATRRAMVVVQVFAPNFADDGTAQALELAAVVQALYEGRSLPVGDADQINADPADVRRIGADGAWFQTNVTIPFSYRETF